MGEIVGMYAVKPSYLDRARLCTRKSSQNASVAQLGEQMPLKHKVEGSIPSGGTMFNIKLWFLTWISGLTKLIDGVIIFFSLGTLNPDFTQEIVSEISSLYFTHRFK